MPTIYSHSRLSTFEQCKFKFKLRYIDQIIPEVESTIEAHLGSAVHDTLEWLYIQVSKNNNLPNIDQVITKYTENWQESYKENIKIVRENLTAKDYFNKGVKFLLDYYLKHQPFNDGTIELEKRIIINLDPENKYRVQGFIDRLVFNKENGCYEIHDYKTANRLPTQEKMDQDRQLALYSIGVKDIYKTQSEIKLTWHYLAHNTKIVSKRTQEQLEELKQEIINLIKEIESTTHFPATKSILCDWCEYKTICPVWGNSLDFDKRKLITKSGEEIGPLTEKQMTLVGQATQSQNTNKKIENQENKLNILNNNFSV